jgi:arabinan endo-1,5-alpha-L-arabinosidase
MAESTNNYPILTHSYMFENHPGWSGNAHCAVLNDNGRYFMLHQGRLAPDNLMMQMHVREIKWLPSGWPVVASQRYAGIEERSIKSGDIPGEWELVHLTDLTDQTDLWQGQIPPGGWTYDKKAFNVSIRTGLKENGELSSGLFKQWHVVGETLELDGNVCMLFSGWDWENERETIMFSGILSDGTSVWGKKVE